MTNFDLDDFGDRIEADSLALRKEIRYWSERIRTAIIICSIALALVEAVGFVTCFVLIATQL